MLILYLLEQLAALCCLSLVLLWTTCTTILLGESQVSSLCLLRWRVGLRHVAWISHHKSWASAWSCNSAYLKLSVWITRAAICELIEVHSRLFDHIVVHRLLLVACWWVDSYEASTNHSIKLVTFGLQLSPLLLTLLLGHSWIFVLPPIELLCSFFLSFSLSFACQI